MSLVVHSLFYIVLSATTCPKEASISDPGNHVILYHDKLKNGVIPQSLSFSAHRASCEFEWGLHCTVVFFMSIYWLLYMYTQTTKMNRNTILSLIIWRS